MKDADGGILQKYFTLNAVSVSPALKGRNITAQGSALGIQEKNDSALKGRDINYAALTGLGLYLLAFPGLHPGL